MSPGQTVELGGETPTDDAAKRLQWLKSVAPNAAPPPATPSVKKRFLQTRGVGVRLDDPPPSVGVSVSNGSPGENPATGSLSKIARTADTHAAEPHGKVTPSPDARVPAPHRATSPGAGIAEAHPAEPQAKSTPSPESKVPASHHATPSTSGIAEAHGKSTPPGETKVAGVHPAAISAAATPASGKPADSTHHAESVASARRTPEPRTAEVHAANTPAPKASPPPTHAEGVASAKRTPDLRITEIHPVETPVPKPRLPATRVEIVTSRYPWKTGIVTTVFWIGEPVGGNNFTPNCSSSWDANWTQSYGGYDNPHPEARRNFLPVNFIPRQNPFYVALPYNDVTRGTTKPEARVVIPWFREAFRKEGQSVCRDRWVAIRNRAGRVGYAQWSDCGPFRTDHWQYVFGMEKPKPNLNEGAGLDVSPALRDYLGLESTDVTDWKFVEAKDVPSGPWLLYGENNPFAQKRYHATNTAAKPEGAAAIEVAANRGHSF